MAVRILLCVLALAASAAAQEPRLELRYELHPGVHLIYRQVFERESVLRSDLPQPEVVPEPSFTDFVTRTEWTSHVLVVGEQAGSLLIGFQRNRTRAELLRYREKGKDQLAREQPHFAERLAHRSPYFAEANRLSLRGWAQLSWTAVREAPSMVLLGVHEIEALPLRPVGVGDAWTSDSLLGFEFRTSGWDRLHDQDCLRVDGTASQNTLRVRYWFCPASGLLERLEFEADYLSYLRFGFHEKLTWELMERRRDEDIRAWLAQPELQQGALAALFISDSLPVEPAALAALLETKEPAVQKIVLALAYRRRLPVPVQKLAPFVASDDPRLRTLAVRALEGTPKDAARALIEQALADPDGFVREAALAWVRARWPREKPLIAKTADEVSAAWDSLSELPRASPGDPQLEALARAVRSGRVLPDWNCGETPEWSARVLWEQRFPPQPPGTTARLMTAAVFRGTPYVVHAPLDYRGDEPFPLLVYLGGGGGRAVQAALSAQDTVTSLGYLVVYPEANEYWWHERPAAVVAALLDEVLRTFNVDPNRVYLAGLSNGGTGTLYYASYWTHRFAAAAPMMGAGLYTPEHASPLLLANLGRLPLLFLHGDKDEIIPVRATEGTVSELRRLAPAAPAELHIFPGRGHEIGLGSDDGLAVAFFQQHARVSFPRVVTFYTRTLQFPRRYWIEILDKGEGVAEVEATIGEDNTVRLTTRNVTRLRLLLRRELFPRASPVRVLLNDKEVFAGALPEDCELLQRSWWAAADPFLAYSAELTFTVPH